MGNLTTVTLHNDAIGAFREHPEEFGKALLDGVDAAAFCSDGEVTVPFYGYSNYITVQRSRHADERVVYFHRGNQVLALGRYEPKMLEWAKRDPEIVKKYIKSAIEELREALKSVEELKKGAVNGTGKPA